MEGPWDRLGGSLYRLGRLIFRDMSMHLHICLHGEMIETEGPTGHGMSS